MNKKGFTLVEIITTITIVGILSAVAIPMVNKYFLSAQKKTYDTYVETLYNATRNYLEKNTLFIPATTNSKDDLTVLASTLLDEGYIDALVDPENKNLECDYDNSKIIVHNNDTSKKNPDLTYNVTLKCSKEKISKKY